MQHEQPRLMFCGYEFGELLHRGERSIVYRARRAGEPSVVLKLTDGARGEERGALKREWELLRQLEGAPGIVQAVELARESSTEALVLRDSGGSSLQNLALAGILPIQEFLSLSMDLVDALAEVHRRGIIHRDVHPGNFVLNPLERTVELIDFASATLLARETALFAPLRRFTEALAYVSPEQTGRMNRAVDYRTDYYSLGVTLFELLTGVLPFSSEDPLELVHAHVARQPPHPAELNPSIPSALSEIILKLLAKDADQRYHTLPALRHDLERCRDVLASGAADVTFAVGERDRAERFRLPQRLYGRDAELDRVNAVFERTLRGQGALLTVSGGPGVGKSALIRELVRPLGARRGFFAVGKFEQYEQQVPHAAIGQAFDAIAQQLLTEDASGLTAWRRVLLDGISNLGGVLVELAPALDKVLGPQRPLPVLSPSEARIRLQQAVDGFFKALASFGRPLCLFLDDVQWANADSLALVKDALLAAKELPVLVVFAYREQDVTDGHAVLAMSQELAAAGISCECLSLLPLSVRDCTAYVADALSMEPVLSEPLGEAVHTRTGGNPFFVKAFLASLHAEGLLEDATQSSEALQIAIARRGVTENVVDLLVGRITRLPAETQEVLKVAACIGSRFDVATLHRALGRSVGDALWPALVAELVVPLDRVQSALDLSAEHGAVVCRFAHDRVQQAVISLLDDRTLSALHWTIGRSLWDASALEHPRELFECATHLNKAASLLSNDADRVQIAEVNLRAARTALSRAAAPEACEFARAGLSVLPADAWSAHYALARDLHVVSGEAAFAVADHESLDSIVATVMENAKHTLDVVLVRRLQGEVYHTTFRIAEAFKTYTEALALLGIALPEKSTPAVIGEELRLTAEALRHKRFEELLHLPECADPVIGTAIELLSRFVLLTYATTSELLPILVCRMVRLSIQHGNTVESANGYTFYGLLLSRDHDIDRACRFGRLALDLAHKLDDKKALSQTYLYANYQLMHWKMPLADLASSFRSAHDYAVEVGAPFNTACSLATYSISRFWAGDELPKLTDDMERYRATITRLRQGMVLNWHEILLQAALNLRAPEASSSLCGPVYDETERLHVHTAAGDHSALFNYHVAKVFLCYLCGDITEALAYADSNQPFVPLYGTALWAVPVLYVDSLVRVSACDRAGPVERERLLKQVHSNLEKLLVWLPHNRRSLEHKVRTIQAALLRVESGAQDALPAFSEAVALARAAAGPHEEGITCELASKCAAEAGNVALSRSLLRVAHRAFVRWGATSKAALLERRNPSLLPPAISKRWASKRGADHGFDLLDVVSVLNASRLLSSEIKRERLLDRLLSLLMESGGAETGLLLLQKDRQWVIEAARSVDRGTITMLEAIPCDKAWTSKGIGVAATIVNYVATTGQTIVLDEASATGRFVHDPHVLAQKVLSIICLPLKRQGEVVGIAYLENNAARGAFTVNNVRILEMLSTQAVISLENAVLYDRLEQKVLSRTQELEEKNAELGKALQRLTVMQQQLVTQEKLAALGALTAGIAHEIKNPLNFVTNFADVLTRLAEDLRARLGPELERSSEGVRDDIVDLLKDVTATAQKVREHGSRASAIVSGMALHARGRGGNKERTDLNSILSHSVMLASHATNFEHMRDIRILTDYDTTIGDVEVNAQDLSRVFVNLLNNASYALEEKRATHPEFVPTIWVSTKCLGSNVEVRIRDNGTGIPAEVRGKIFVPFYTTKAAGDGSGLGLSISHDIVVHGHHGELRAESVEGDFAEFIVTLPRSVN